MAYRKTERVREQLADKRSRILGAARQLISEGGFNDAPMTAIAGLAGVATGTVYRYFPSKTDLLAEVVRLASQRELEVVAGIVMTEGTAAQRLSEAIAAFAGRALRGRRLAYALVAEPVAPEIDATRLKYRRALGRVFEAIIDQGIRAGEFPAQPVPAAAASLVGACIEGLVGPLSPEAMKVEDDGAALVAAIQRFCLRAVTAHD
ncbi:MAG: TetR/AcrR family transcriptional regulator [Ferrovibrionaceae bacterium]